MGQQMDTSITKKMIEVIRAERDRRYMDLVEDKRWWMHYDEPIINELCLMLLVTIWHQVERELIWIATRVTKADDGSELDGEYWKRVEIEREKYRKGGGKGKLIAKLGLDKFDEWKSMTALNFLANSYKHDPRSTPADKDLANLLRLNQDAQSTPLAENQELREKLAESLGLREGSDPWGDGADYCDIADAFLDRAASFLKKVAAQPGLNLCPLKFFPVSLDERDFTGS
jgi:hypothetical protein